ncbi:MAG: hypothetical protein Kow0022_08110 [Phycisphaerales bacterium]
MGMETGLAGNDLVAIVTIGGGLLVAIVAIVGSLVHSASRTRELEESRRELAAYVAEGSMTPDDAERILNAGPPYSRSKRS